MDAIMLPKLYTDDSEINRHGHKFTEAAYNSLIQRYYAFLVDNTMECYLELIRHHPQIEQYVSQKDIAEYLQISSNHLCRIRKELLNKG